MGESGPTRGVSKMSLPNSLAAFAIVTRDVRSHVDSGL